MTNNTDPQKTIIEFNNEVNGFIKDNYKRIACIITSAVAYIYQPLVVSYQRYFNMNVKEIYDSKAIYAHNHELPNFIYSYFILTKEGKENAPATVKEHCDIYVGNFMDFNKETFAAISAEIYDVGKFEVIERVNHGDMGSFKDIGFLSHPNKP